MWSLTIYRQTLKFTYLELKDSWKKKSHQTLKQTIIESISGGFLQFETTVHRAHQPDKIENIKKETFLKSDCSHEGFETFPHFNAGEPAQQLSFH